MFAMDLETAGTTEKSVVLSIAVTYFEPEETYTFEQLVNEQTCFVKFNARDQMNDGRTCDRDCLDWWKKQCDIVKQKSLLPSPDDISVVDGLKIVHEFIAKRRKTDEYVFIRGNLDNFCADSLCKQYGVPVLFNYWEYLDFRTAIIMTKETSSRYGYCEVEGFDRNLVYKHDPCHDNALEIMMMLYGK